MPRSIRHRSNKLLDFSKRNKIIFLFFLVVIGIGAIVIFYQHWVPQFTQALLPAWQKTQDLRTAQTLPSIPVTQMPDEDPVRSSTPEPTGTATQQRSETPTPTIYPSTLALDTPIGADVQFVIHQVRPGESLFQYAREYNTNVDAIRAVNYDLPSVLMVDWIVIIPVDIEDPTGLPLFEAFQVTMRGLTVESLSGELSVEPENLAKYNNVPLDYTFSRGDWILVPRE